MRHFLGVLLATLMPLANVTLTFAQWVQTNGPQSEARPSAGLINTLAVCSTGVDSATLFAGTAHDGVFRSTDDGASWTAVNSGLTDTSIKVLAVNGSTLFAGTLSGVYRSTNNGAIWNLVAYTPTLALAVSPSRTANAILFAGMTQSGVIISGDNGDSWTNAQPGFYDVIRSLCVSPDRAGGINLLVGTEMSGIFLSTNYWTSWISVNSGLTDNEIPALAAKSNGAGGMNIFAGTYSNGVFLSTNNGTSWNYSGLVQAYTINTFFVDDTNLFVGTLFGLYLSTNNGASWAEADSGLTNKWVTGIAISGSNIFAGTSGNGVWRCSLPGIVTGVRPNLGGVPMHFSLSQNYPNPFNPTTMIAYQFPSVGHVTLKVYDVLGREVKSLVNERQTAGSHSVAFDGSNLSSGVYLYRLQAGSYTETKKLVLLK